jgi:hypothetical protein
VGSSGQIDQACLDVIQKYPFELFADTSAAGIDRSELSRFTAIISKSFTTNHQQNSDTSNLDADRTRDTDPSLAEDGSQPTNVCDRWMSSPSVEGKADIVADDGSDDGSDLDDPFGISPCLVSESASLSQYRDRSPMQTSKNMLSKDTLAMDEPILAAHISPVVGTSALAHAGPTAEPLEST